MTKRTDLELLSPAGGPEQLLAAVHFGADAVYLAGRRWGMRAGADNFTDDELATAVTYAHAHDVRVHLALNTLMYDTDVDELPGYLRRIDELGVDAVIVADLGAITLARRHAPHTAIHVSTQASVTNVEAARTYAALGATRIVLAREMTLTQIAELHARLGNTVKLEAFAHGSMCMAISGRCLLSSALMGTQRSAAFGSCAQPCRWAWSLADELHPDQRLDLEIGRRGSYLLSANDLNMLGHLDELAEAGITAVKVEGRNKGTHYVATVTNAYRHVIDGADPAAWMGELDATSHRPFSTGFYFGSPTQNPGRVDYARERTLVAVVDGCIDAHDVMTGGVGDQSGPDVDRSIDARSSARATTPKRCDGTGGKGSGSALVAQHYCVEVTCRNRADVDDRLIALSAGADPHEFTLGTTERWDPDDHVWQGAEGMRRNQQRYRLFSSFPLQAGDLICRLDHD